MALQAKLRTKTKMYWERCYVILMWYFDIYDIYRKQKYNIHGYFYLERKNSKQKTKCKFVALQSTTKWFKKSKIENYLDTAYMSLMSNKGHSDIDFGYLLNDVENGLPNLSPYIYNVYIFMTLFTNMIIFLLILSLAKSLHLEANKK